MSFELRDHTADVAIEARGGDLGETFAALADGMAAAMYDGVPECGDRFDVEVSAESLEAALFDYLDELIYQRDVRGVLPVENDAVVAGEDGAWRVIGSARGVPLDVISAREVKGVTYSEMALDREEGGWYAYVVLDV